VLHLLTAENGTEPKSRGVSYSVVNAGKADLMGTSRFGAD
jgi:hypothetical protein